MPTRPIDETSKVTTKRKAFGQLLLCKGCCCGKTEKGYPEVPVDRIKAAWKASKLNPSIQLSISGCLGPCDVPNVAVIVTPEGTAWFGDLVDDAPYDALIAWAESCKLAGALVPVPDLLRPHRFRYLLPSPQPEPEPEPDSIAVS